MDNKKADNVILKSKEKIDILDKEIYTKKSEIKKIDNMREEFISINKSVNKSLELLSTSTKNTGMLNKMYEDNTMFIKKVNSLLSEKKLMIEKNLKNLYSRKDQIDKEQQKEE